MAGQDQFHVDDIEPLVEFEADLLEMADLFKVEPGVQGDASGLPSVNGGDDGAVAEMAGADNQVLEEMFSDAAPVELVMDINRILNRMPVGTARVIGRK